MIELQKAVQNAQRVNIDDTDALESAGDYVDGNNGFYFSLTFKHFSVPVYSVSLLYSKYLHLGLMLLTLKFKGVFLTLINRKIYK